MVTSHLVNTMSCDSLTRISASWVSLRSAMMILLPWDAANLANARPIPNAEVLAEIAIDEARESVPEPPPVITTILEARAKSPTAILAYSISPAWR